MTLQLLHLEDDRREAGLIAERLRTDGVDADIELVRQRDGFAAALARGGHDVLLLDFNLPGYDGLAALALAREHDPDLPIIVLSGHLSEEDAAACLRYGAADYVLKDRPSRLASAIRNALVRADAARKQRSAEEALHRSEERFREFAEQSDDVFWFVELEPERVSFVSPAVRRVWRLEPDVLAAAPRAWIDAAHDDDRPRLAAAYQALLDGRSRVLDEVYRLASGEIWVNNRATAIVGEGGRLIRISGLAKDVTAERRLAAQRAELDRRLFESQKLESLGMLAAGVAHDFNNVLSGLLGNLTLLRRRLPSRFDHVDLVEAMEAAVMGASELTRQMLAYAGKGRLDLRLVHLGDAVRSALRLVHGAIGHRHELVCDVDDAPQHVRADETQLVQVVLNLLMNAAQAIGGPGGRIGVRTGAVTLAADHTGAWLPAVPPAGTYAFVEVTDNGVGMDDETKARIFDPFFTTKPTGRGLGLAAVLGIVRSHGGGLQVETSPGAGARFRVLLPLASFVVDPERLPASPGRAGDHTARAE